MGRLLSQLPTDVHLGKFLLIATVFRCLDPALTIAATLNSKSPFLTPLGLEAEAEKAKSSFRVGSCLTLWAYRSSLTHQMRRKFRLLDNPQRLRKLATRLRKQPCAQVLQVKLPEPPEFAADRGVATTIPWVKFFASVSFGVTVDVSLAISLTRPSSMSIVLSSRSSVGHDMAGTGLDLLPSRLTSTSIQATLP